MVASMFALFSTLFVTALVPSGSGAPDPAGQQSSAAVAAQVTLTGTIRDATTGQALESAQIHIPALSLGALSNPNGRYLISLGDGLKGREVEIRVELIGYTAQTRTVTLAEGTTTVDFSLVSTALRLQELVVTGVAGSSAAVTLPRSVEKVASPGIMLRGPTTISGQMDVGRESYAEIVENTFRRVTAEPLSTFAIDVDRASYSNVRRFLNAGSLPPANAVRVEELINYFPYQDEAPRGDVPFAVTTDVMAAPWAPAHRLVRIGLKGTEVDLEDVPASNLVFLLDVSGSMSSPDKLPLLKTAFAMLVNELRPQDRVAIVVYAGNAGLVLPSTPGTDRGSILGALDRLQAGGSTAGGAGIQLAYSVARENFIEGGNNRVILATDGDFNVGASSDQAMVELIESRRDQGTFLTVLGFGTGNLQDAKMEQVANHGNGNFHYIDSASEARKVLVEEMGGTLFTIAKDVKIQVEFNPERVAEYRLVGYENRLLAPEDFNDDRKDAGELGAGHTVTALYEVVPTGVSRGTDPLRYGPNQPRADGDHEDELLFVKLRYKDPQGEVSRLITRPVEDRVTRGTPDTRFAAAVAGWGMLLRDSRFAGDLTWDAVEALAADGLGFDPGGYRAEFLRLVELSSSLSAMTTASEPVR